MSSANVTRRRLTLGTRDANTGWMSKTYTDLTVQAEVVPKGQVFSMGNAGYLAKYEHTGFSDDEWNEGDQLITADGTRYEVASLTPNMWLDTFGFYTLNLRQITPYDAERENVSLQWHTDSEAITTDPRIRTKTWLNAEINPSDISGEYTILFAGADYLMSYEFTVNNLDAVIAIDTVDSQPEYTYNHKPYMFNEKVAVHLYAVNKTAVTAPQLLEDIEQEIRRAVASNLTNPTVNTMRAITTIKGERSDIGGVTLWHTVVDLNYSRANDDYYPATPAITWGNNAGTFIFPNVTRYTPPLTNNDVTPTTLRRVPGIRQSMGSNGLEIQLTCDLDYSPANLTWKRPQTADVKTDTNNYQVFLDIMHGALSSQPYQTLWIDGMMLKVRLIRMEPDLIAEGNKITLTFEEYNATNQVTESYLTRFGF